MSQSHRGLPPPSAMALPVSAHASIGPIPTHLWQGPDDTIRSLIHAKAEEERHFIEVERTKQEELRLETRRLELTMLREALSGGMPGPLVALMFAGTSNLRSAGSEILHGYISDLQHQHLRMQQGPPPPTPELRRETRLIGQAHHSGPHHVPMAPPSTTTWETQTSTFQYQPVRGNGSRSSQSSQALPPNTSSQSHRSSLPRLNTSDMSKSSQISLNNPILNPSPMPHSAGQQSNQPSEPASAQQSQGIYFHHWQPPTNTSTGNSSSAQRSASPHRQPESQFSHHAPPHLSNSESVSSPKRRKTTSGAGYSPPFAAGVPSSSTPARRRAHSRQRSDVSSGGMRGYEPYHRPSTRQRRSGSGHEDQSQASSEGAPTPMAMSQDGKSGMHQHSSIRHDPGPSPPQHQQQPTLPPPRPYSGGPDRSRELPYPPHMGNDGPQPPQRRD